VGVDAPVRIPLAATADPLAAARVLRGDRRPVALVGAWAGGGALLASEPLEVVTSGDPFAVLASQPLGPGQTGSGTGVGGGWFGWIGYRCGIEPRPPGPPRPVPRPDFSLGFYDHLLRFDGARWWFEALRWDARVEGRLAELRARLASLARPGPASAAPLGPFSFDAAGHRSAVAEALERIAAGELFQASITSRFAGDAAGDPLDLLAPAPYAAVVDDGDHATVSRSPELFLRRAGREVVTLPIKGTSPDRARLLASAKDRAENVMIADLMRNDLGRVAEYGSVRVARLAEAERHGELWHLVSEVRTTLRADVDDAALLRATFPPGSVTGAPKVQSLRVIAELEATGREAYTGALGYASPVAGLEMSVLIRTLELAGGRAWLGAGGGVVADSDPDREVGEAEGKARSALGPGARVRRRPARPGVLPPRALAGGADRPDPSLGVFTTFRVADADRHLARVRASARELYGVDPQLPAVGGSGAAGGSAAAALRVEVLPDGSVTVAPRAVPAPPAAPLRLVPFLLPGGLGAHKWRDRRLLDELTARAEGGVPLLVDADGHVLEAAWAAVVVVEAGRRITPPADGRILPSLSVGDDAARETVTLERLRGADAVLLGSALRTVPAELSLLGRARAHGSCVGK